MFKNFLKVICTGLVAVGLVSCAGGQLKPLDPNTKILAGTVLLESASAVFDANPELKPKVVQAVTIAKGLLTNTASVTHEGVVTYVQATINAYPNLNVHAKRILDVLALYYIPTSWSTDKLTLSSDEKDLLLQGLDILLVAAQT